MKASTQFKPQEVDAAGPEANHGLENTLETLKKKELNTQDLQNQEEMPKCQVIDSDNKQKQKVKKGTRPHSHKSPHQHQKKQKTYSDRKEKTGKLLTGGYSQSFVSHQDFLQVTLIQGQLHKEEDYLSSDKSYSSRLSERDHGKKQKIYETDEFIDYLLNHYYYETPKYASVCPEPSHTTSTCQWERSVRAKGNGFQVNLRKCKCHSTRLSQMQNSQKTGKVNYTKECTKEFKDRCKDTADEAGDHLTSIDGKGYLFDQAYQVKDSKSRSLSQVSSPNRSSDLELQLTDFLEEISSDSECFSEILSANQDENEKSVATYEGSPEKKCLGTDEIITGNQEIRSSQQTLYSKWKSDAEEKYSKYQVRKPGKRSEYERRCLWLEGENNSMRDKKSNSQKREIPAPKYLFDKSYYHKSSSRDLLDHTARKRRRFSDHVFDKKVNHRPFYVPITSSKNANSFYLRNVPQRRETLWMSEYNQDTRWFKRHENATDFMLTSGSYYTRRNSQEHTDYRRYI